MKGSICRRCLATYFLPCTCMSFFSGGLIFLTTPKHSLPKNMNWIQIYIIDSLERNLSCCRIQQSITHSSQVQVISAIYSETKCHCFRFWKLQTMNINSKLEVTICSLVQCHFSNIQKIVQMLHRHQYWHVISAKDQKNIRRSSK